MFYTQMIFLRKLRQPSSYFDPPNILEGRVEAPVRNRDESRSSPRGAACGGGANGSDASKIADCFSPMSGRPPFGQVMLESGIFHSSLSKLVRRSSLSTQILRVRYRRTPAADGTAQWRALQ
jgi:hypothetical protein